MFGRFLRIHALILLVGLAAAMLPGPFAVAGAETVRGLPDRRTQDGEALQPYSTPETETPLFQDLELEPGALAELSLDGGGAVYGFTPASNGVYDICLFPAGEEALDARVELWQGGLRLAVGDASMPALSQRLTAGVRCQLRLTGAGRARLEVARHALSRCFDLPMTLDPDGDAYRKAVARAGDVHWYAVESVSALPVALAGVPAAEDLRLQAQLFDADGRMLAEAARTVGGAFLLDFSPSAGQRLYIRVSALDGGTGLYDLRMERSAGGVLPDVLTLSRQSLTLEGRSSLQLTARISPAGAGGTVFWESSDPQVARVDASGVVTGRREGMTVVTAYGAGGVSARCRVEVVPVAVQGVDLAATRMELGVGDDAAIEYFVLPEHASDQRVAFAAVPEGVVEVDRAGVLRGVAEGEATVLVRTLDGGFEAALTVKVGPARRRWRALLVGEQNYASTVAAVRQGSINSVSGIRGMLGTMSYDGARFEISTLLDASRDGVAAGIRDALGGARPGDFSIFYITCHGYYADGMTYFQMYDGSVLTAAELELALRTVQGELLVVIDCCGSGGAIGRYSATADILKGIGAVFGGAAGPGALCSSQYRVLASAALEQDSYRISFSEDAVESDMATVFARALCEAGGWSIDRGARGPMRADADYDGVVTLAELYAYTARRVMWYLDMAGDLAGRPGAYVQTVQVWPEGDALPLFSR